jgi:outer membrane protein assembly factor BamB
MRRTVTCAALLAFILGMTCRAGEHWPQFRGPGSAGVAEGENLPDTWDTKKNVVWAVDVPGRGWSSPVVWGDRIFLTAVLSDKAPTPRKGLYIQDLKGKIPPGEHRWVVYCFDWKTGKQLWERTAHKGTPEGPIHLKNTYASETPVTDGERVYAYFGNLGLFCYDVDGKELWARKWGAFPTRFGWGTGASPALHRGRVYVVNDNEEKSFLTALDARTGKDVWTVERDEKSNWSTPFVWENGQRTEIVTAGTGKVRAYDLGGKLLWEFKGMSSITIPTPLSAHGLLYVSSGHLLDGMRPVYAIRPGAAGDISLKKGETGNEAIAWCQRGAAAYHPSPVVVGDHLYVLYDKGMLACYDARTGKEVYGKQRIDPDSDKFTASPWAYNGKIFCLSEDGDTFVIRAGPRFEVLGKNPLGEMCLSSPAVTRDSLIVRTMTKLYRIANRGK